MPYDSLKLFNDIVQTRSFSRAATLNGLSQSAASQQIQELEKGFGVILLDRSRRPLVVTRAGEMYATFCRDVLQRKRELDDALARMKQQLEGLVRVSCIYSVGITEIVQLTKKFTLDNPETRIQLKYLRPERVYAAVLADESDIGVISYPEPQPELEVIPWRREEMVIAAAPDHPLAKRAATEQGPIPVVALDGVDFVGFDEDLPIRHQVDRFLKHHNVRVNLALHFDNIEMIKEAVEHGVGISILPFRAMREEMRQKRLTAIRLKGETLYRPLGIIHRRRKKLHSAAQAFLELLAKHPSSEGA